MSNMKKVWVIVERPSPAEEPQNYGASNDEEFMREVLKQLRYHAEDQTYWLECLDYQYI